ncbi:Ras-related protein Rab-23 [Toxocara canis]|uniref:Ras-related protein Rab-23 n=2 Tax=Toxocara canis TaxID=6265 RepID=A0A0B2VEM4_TOXCA|nr:Ras-related protein Rab-23 [Toxocara canis]VDM44477.1 unnamed protein product [Toxocara canis]
MDIGEQVLKMIFLGSKGCGKTTIASILTGSYNFTTKDYKMTQGVDLFEKKFSMGDRAVNVLLVDTSGHPLYSWLVDQVSHETNAALIYCFDTTDRESFDALEKIVNNTAVKTGVVVGCKSDLSMRRAVPNHIAEQFAAKYHMNFVSTSTRISTAEMESLFHDVIGKYLDF